MLKIILIALLMYSVDYGESKILKIILSAKPDINSRDRNGRTALLRAKESTSPDLAKILVEAGATP
ncbi:MAG: ankyrin repeat domain-containing protein [Blastocatellia bacterium]|nr:ankyrin repeat domain-containing protein [Blastocatellia bacterium]